METIELLKKMISIPSFSGNEERVADLMVATWVEHGYSAERSGNNVWVKSRNFDPVKPTILLDAHLDTVRPNGNWEKDPFTAVVEDGKLYGLGSNDTGGSVVAMMAAFLQLAEKKQAYNLGCLESAEEENTGKNGIQRIVAEKGLMVVDCVAKGKSGHAARNEGLNAIYEAISDIEWFRSYRFGKESPLLGKVKMTVTGIEAGTLHNVVPAECRFMVDIRVNEYYTNSDIYETIRRNVKSEVRPRSFSLNSSAIPIDHPIVLRCKDLGLKTYGSPTTSNQAVIPYPSLKIGPGDSARSHTADEYIGLDEIEEGIMLFVKLLDGFCF